MQTNYAIANKLAIDETIPAPLGSFLAGCNQIHNAEPLVRPSEQQLARFTAALDTALAPMESTRKTDLIARSQRRETIIGEARVSLTSLMFGVYRAEFASTQRGEYKAYSSLAVALLMSSIATSMFTATALVGAMAVSWPIAVAVGTLYGALDMLFGRTLLLPRLRMNRLSLIGPKLLVRGLLSLFMSAALAQGMILTIYKQEVKATLAVQDQAQVDKAVKSELFIFNEQILFTSQQVSVLEKKVFRLETEADRLEQQLKQQIAGGNNERTAGDGPIARSIRKSLENKRAELDEESAQLNSFESTYQKLVSDTAERTKMTREDVADRYARSHGLGARLRAIEEQPGSSGLRLFLMLLLVLIGLFPLLARALFGETTFERELLEENQVRVVREDRYRHLRLVEASEVGPNDEETLDTQLSDIEALGF
jgi:Domain of unknown function (DUF4407)